MPHILRKCVILQDNRTLLVCYFQFIVRFSKVCVPLISLPHTTQAAKEPYVM